MRMFLLLKIKKESFGLFLLDQPKTCAFADFSSLEGESFRIRLSFNEVSVKFRHLIPNCCVALFQCGIFDQPPVQPTGCNRSKNLFHNKSSLFPLKLLIIWFEFLRDNFHCKIGRKIGGRLVY